MDFSFEGKSDDLFDLGKGEVSKIFSMTFGAKSEKLDLSCSEEFPSISVCLRYKMLKLKIKFFKRKMSTYKRRFKTSKFELEKIKTENINLKSKLKIFDDFLQSFEDKKLDCD
jgi:hypothetical protein